MRELRRDAFARAGGGASLLRWTLMSVTAVFVAGTVFLSALNFTNGVGGVLVEVLIGGVLLGFVAMGMVVVSHRPGNPVGWILAGAGVLTVTAGFAEAYAVHALFTDPGLLPGGEVMAWLSLWVFIPSLFATPALLFLLFPDGRLLGRRWRVVLWLVVATTGAAVTSVILAPVLNDAPFKGVSNPLGIVVPPALHEALANFGWPGMALGLLASAAAMVVRLRSSRGVERQQLKWIAAASAVLSIASLTGVVSYFAGYETIGSLLTILGFFLVSFAAGYAILRYRLYDIDAIINKTLVYGSLTLSLAAVYLAVVAFSGYIIRALTGSESQITIVASTLAIAALFGPLRKRIQTFVDRRFYRQKYDAAKTLEAFSAKLRDETSLDSLGENLTAAVEEALRPSHASLWLWPTGESVNPASLRPEVRQTPRNPPDSR